MLVDRQATFKATILDHGVTLTTNKFPQFTAKFLATEIWDPDENIWAEWSEYAQEITGYFVLFGSKGETLTCQQLKKTLGWDGLSFSTLANGDYSSAVVQIRVENHTYDGKTTLQVAWIDEESAIPGTTVQKLDKAGLDALDSQYAKLLKAGGKKAAPATAPQKTPKPTIPGTGKTVKPATKKSNVPDTPVEDDDKGVTSGPPEDEAETTESGEVKPMTKDEAWDGILAIVPGANDDEKVVVSISTEWTRAVKEIGGGKKTKDMTKEEFGQVYEAVITKLVKF